MSIQINSFPTLTKNHLDLIKTSCTITAMKYSVFSKTYPLKFNIKDSLPQGNSYMFSDVSGIWHPNDNNLDVHVDIKIEDTQPLFGVGGIASSNSKLGIAVLWKDIESSIQDSQVIGYFSKKDKRVNEKTIVRLPAGILRGTLILEFILFLNDKGMPIPSEGFFATEQGTVFGDIAEHRLIIEGNGSIFPISETDGDPEDPLWWVEYNSDNPLIDPFITDHFCIYINKANKSYSNLKTNDDNYNTDLFIEILASSFQILFDNYYKYINENNSQENFADGSIGMQISYFKSIFNWQYEKSFPQKFAKDIRRSLQALM